MKNLNLTLSLLMTLLCTSCVKSCGTKGPADLNPEEVVEAYLEVALNMTALEQKEALLFYTTGPLMQLFAQRMMI